MWAEAWLHTLLFLVRGWGPAVPAGGLLAHFRGPGYSRGVPGWDMECPNTTATVRSAGQCQVRENFSASVYSRATPYIC